MSNPAQIPASTHRIELLPKWAQNYIAIVEKRVTNLEAELADTRTLLAASPAGKFIEQLGQAERKAYGVLGDIEDLQGTLVSLVRQAQLPEG